MSVQQFATPRRGVRTRKRVRPVRYEVIDPRDLHTIVQSRGESRSDLSVLGQNIAELGLQQSVGVAELDRAHCAAYLKHFSEVFGVSITIDQVPPNVNGYYYIVIWGHSRTQACWDVWEYGCVDCRSKGGSSVVARCFRRHPNIDPAGIDAKVFRNISPEEAMMRQIAENSYEAPNRDREAAAIRNAWLVRRHSDKKLTMKKFAQQTGRSPAFVADSLRFCNLPDEVQKLVEAGLAFTGALEYARMQAAGMAADQVTRAAMLAFTQGYTVGKIKEQVKLQVEQATNGMEDLFLLDESEDDLHRRTVATIIEGRTSRAFALETAALRQVRDAQERGLLPASNPLLNPQVRKAKERGDVLRNKLFV